MPYKVDSKRILFHDIHLIGGCWPGSYEKCPAKASDLCNGVLTSKQHRMERLIYFTGANKRGAHKAAHIEGAGGVCVTGSMGRVLSSPLA